MTDRFAGVMESLLKVGKLKGLDQGQLFDVFDRVVCEKVLTSTTLRVIVNEMRVPKVVSDRVYAALTPLLAKADTVSTPCATDSPIVLPPFYTAPNAKAFISAVESRSIPILRGTVLNEFDRNDVYGTNQDALNVICAKLAYPLKIVALIFPGQARYVTWCHDIVTFSVSVRSGETRLNKKANGRDFTVTEVIPTMGRVGPDDVDSFLCLLEQMTEMWDGRVRGYNVDTDHIVNRSAYLFLNDNDTLFAASHMDEAMRGVRRLQMKFDIAVTKFDRQLRAAQCDACDLLTVPDERLRNAEMQGVYDALLETRSSLVVVHRELMDAVAVASDVHGVCVVKMSYLIGRHRHDPCMAVTKLRRRLATLIATAPVSTTSLPANLDDVYLLSPPLVFTNLRVGAISLLFK